MLLRLAILLAHQVQVDATECFDDISVVRILVSVLLKAEADLFYKRYYNQ